MSTLYIDRKNVEIRLDGEAIAFYSSDRREGVVPIKPLKRVIICGRVTLDSSVLCKLADEGVSVIMLSGKRLRFRATLHGRMHNNGVLRFKQYEKASSSFAFIWSVEIVRKKLRGQKRLLRELWERRADRRTVISKATVTLEKVLDSVELLNQDDDVERLRGLEGGAASAYFSAYTSVFPDSLKFKSRNRRPPLDPVNAILSLTYTILHWEAVREAEVAGLDPTIGFYHEFDYGRESLACDMMEPIRPQADRWVWSLFRDRVFTAENFTDGDERPGCYLKKGSRKKFYYLYEEWAKGVRSSLVRDTRDLVRRIMDGHGEDFISE